MMMIFVFMFFAGNSVGVIHADTTTDYELNLTVNRENTSCEYQVAGINLQDNKTMELEVTYENETQETISVLKKMILLNSENCIDGVYTGTFSMSEFNQWAFHNYDVYVTIGTTSIKKEDACDFSIYTDKINLQVDGDTYKEKRTITCSAVGGECVIPGDTNKIRLQLWKKGSDSSTPMVYGEDNTFAGEKLSWKVDTSSLNCGYGEYFAKMVLVNEKISKNEISLKETIFKVEPTVNKITTIKNNSLEKKQSFRVEVSDVKSPIEIGKVEFDIYNSAGTMVYTASGVKKDKKYYAEVNMDKLSYKLDKYTIKPKITDTYGNVVKISKTTVADQRANAKKFKITKKKSNHTSTFALKAPYIPGKVQSIKFFVYKIENGKEKLYKTYKGKYNASKNLYKYVMKNKEVGTYTVYAYGYTNWGEKVLLKKKNLKLKKSDIVKNGWYYEKYNGKTYKFYYINDKKQTDLTKILGIKESNGSNINKFYIEINRAASVVTVYAYDEEKEKYIIPVKAFSVSVGADTYTVAGASSLNEDTSYTPIGNYSICTNGVSVKYSMKQMYEPNGVILYARWTTHIVGNIYFHSIAVGRDSHYALNPNTYNRLGSAASAGCIRMNVADAKWIYDYASTGSVVKIVKGDSSKPGPLGKPKTIKIYSSSVTYDPTDPGVPDSRKKEDYEAGRISGYMTKKGKKVGY